MKRGTIVLTPFPFSDLKGTKRRPAVIISRDSITKEDVIVAFITSVIPRKFSDTDLFFDLSRKDFTKSGLKKKSIIKLDKLVTLNKNIFTGELGEFDRDTIKEMNEKLIIALDLKSTNR